MARTPMQSFNNKTLYSFQADANALGGFLEEPLHKHIPTLAPVSLPVVGGFATARSGAFNLDEVVSCASAYTLVTGRESESDTDDGGGRGSEHPRGRDRRTDRGADRRHCSAG